MSSAIALRALLGRNKLATHFRFQAGHTPGKTAR